MKNLIAVRDRGGKWGQEPPSPRPSPPGERGKRASVAGHSKSVVCALSRGAEDFWMKVRPHPGPLRREREKRALASEVADPPGRCERWGTIRGDAVPAKDELLLAQVVRRPLPLPGGEGRGEGGPASLHAPAAANRPLA